MRNWILGAILALTACSQKYPDLGLVPMPDTIMATVSETLTTIVDSGGVKVTKTEEFKSVKSPSAVALDVNLAVVDALKTVGVAEAQKPIVVASPFGFGYPSYRFQGGYPGGFRDYINGYRSRYPRGCWDCGRVQPYRDPRFELSSSSQPYREPVRPRRP